MSVKNKDEAVAITAETLEAAKQEAVTQTAERMTSLLSEFSQDVALAAFAEKLSVADVKVQQYDKLKTRVVELEAEVAVLKLAKPAAEGEKTPVEHEEAPEKTNGVTLFEKSVGDYKKAGNSTREAFALAAADHPEIANKMALGQK